MPKRPCTQRAEWRVVPGKAAQRLSAHYQLDCDYGTPLIAIFKESDGNEPVYLCGAHVSAVERPARVAGSKDQTAASAPGNVRGEQREKKESRTPQDAANHSVKVDTHVSAVPELIHAQPPKTSRPAKDSVVRARSRDLTYGDSAKALVDEAIWNLEPGDVELYRAALQNGTPAIEASQAAGGQLAIIVRKITEYMQALEALLAQSTSTIKVFEAINQPLETVMLDLIGKTDIGDAEKDAALEQLGAFQESVNCGLGSEITAVQALKITCTVGERANWGVASDIAEELKPAYAAVYTSIRSAILAAIPEITSPFERVVNLYAAKAELESAHPPSLPHEREVVDATTHL